MFEQTFVQTQARTRKPWTVAVSLSLQCLIVGVVLLIPLLRPETLRMPDAPQPHLISTWISQPPLPAQKASARTAVVSVPAPPRSLIFAPPDTRTAAVARIDAPTAEPGLSAWPGPAATSFGLPLAGTPLPPRADVKPPAIPASPKPTASGPLRVSQGVAAASLIFSPHPEYPILAKTTRSQGTVRLEAIIATDGSIRNLRVVSGPPLLVAAALDAVRQWRYRPTLLNGAPVEVVTAIDVNFSLTR